MDYFNILYKLFNKDLSKIFLFLLILIMGFFLYPLYDLNFGYLNRLEQRANVLKILSEIKSTENDNNFTIKKEYNKIIKELSYYNPTVETSFKQYFEVSLNKPTQIEIICKTIAGGSVWFFLIILLISIGKLKVKPTRTRREKNKFYKELFDKVRGITTVHKILFGLLILGCIIGYLTPLFKITSINFVLIPAFELLLFLIINKIYQLAIAIDKSDQIPDDNQGMRGYRN